MALMSCDRLRNMFKSRFRHILLVTFCLGLVSCCDKQELPHNIDRLYSSNVRERNQATLDLARCGSDAASAVPRLGELLYDENVGVQSGAAYALQRIDTRCKA